MAETKPDQAKPQRDLRQELTDKLVQTLEQGQTPWDKPFAAERDCSMQQLRTRNIDEELKTREVQEQKQERGEEKTQEKIVEREVVVPDRATAEALGADFEDDTQTEADHG